MAKTGGMAGCCARDRGNAGASGVAWDRGNTGATDVGGTRPRHNGDMRAKQEGGVAMDNRARGVGGVAVDGSMGAQRVRGGGGMTDVMVRARGVRQWRRVGHDGGGTWGTTGEGAWGTMVRAHGAQVGPRNR